MIDWEDIIMKVASLILTTLVAASAPLCYLHACTGQVPACTGWLAKVDESSPASDLCKDVVPFGSPYGGGSCLNMVVLGTVNGTRGYFQCTRDTDDEGKCMLVPPAIVAVDPYCAAVCTCGNDHYTVAPGKDGVRLERQPCPPDEGVS